MMKTWMMMVAFAVLVIGAMVVAHEEAHAAIYEEFGCKNITFGVDVAHGAYTAAECSLEKEQAIALLQSQAAVENVGYQLALPIALLLLIFFESMRSR